MASEDFRSFPPATRQKDCGPPELSSFPATPASCIAGRRNALEESRSESAFSAPAMGCPAGIFGVLTIMALFVKVWPPTIGGGAVRPATIIFLAFGARALKLVTKRLLPVVGA